MKNYYSQATYILIKGKKSRETTPAKKALVELSLLLKEILELSEKDYSTTIQDLFIDEVGIWSGQASEVFSEEDFDSIIIPIGLLESVLKCAGVVECRELSEELEDLIGESFDQYENNNWEYRKETKSKMKDLIEVFEEIGK